MTDEQARKRILEALDIEVRTTAELPDELRTRILANLPSTDEITAGRWNDESA